MAKQVLDIGFFSHMYSQINGTSLAARFLSEAIAKTGHNVHVFAPKINNGHIKPKNLHFHDLGGARLRGSSEIVLSVPLHKFFFCPHDYLDVGHIMTHTTIGSMAINWCKYLGIPMIGTHNSPLQFYARFFPLIGKLLSKSTLIWNYERHVLNKYDLVHVATKSKKEQLRDFKFKEPIVYFTNGIQDLYFQNLKRNGIREKYEISPDDKLLLYASRKSPEKHMISVIKKFKQIHKEVPDSHLLLVGTDGPSSKYVERLSSKLDYVSCAGKVPFNDLLKLFNTADLTCLWSWIEAEGLVLIEAMAQGTPSVGANGYGIRDVIRHGQTGYLADNLDEFADYVIKLFKDDDLRAEFGKNAKRIAENYRVSKIAETWIKLYKFVINDLYPLKYYNKERKYRVELVKEFVQHLPRVNF